MREKPLGNVVDKIAVGNHPYTLCGLKEKDITLLEKIQADQEKYFEQIIVRKNKKKREIIKLRAAALRMYYVQTFPDDEQEKIDTNSDYQPDNLLQQGLRLLQF